MLAVALVVIVASTSCRGGWPAVVEVPLPVKWGLRLLALTYVFLLVAWPVGADRPAHVRRRARPRCRPPSATRTSSNALQLTVEVAFWAVVINLVFGVGISILLVRYEFPGKRVLSALIDLPMSVSPVVVGLALLLVYNGRDGWFGQPLEENGHPDHLQHPGDDHGHLLRGAAAGDPRGRPGPHRDRRRPGAGGPQPRRQRAPDLPADHPAQHQVGRRVRRGAEPGPLASASSARSRSCPATSPARPRPRR